MPNVTGLKLVERFDSGPSNAAAFVLALLPGAPRLSYLPGTTLFLEGQASSGVFLVQKGCLKLTFTRSDGKSVIVRIAEPGEWIGLDSVFSGRPFEMTAEALDACDVRFIRHDLLLNLMHAHHELLIGVAEQLSNDYRCACLQIRSLALSRTASEKIVHFLLERAAKGRETVHGLRVIIPLKHEEIAQIVGVSRETVTRTLAELKRKRLITVKGAAVTIPDRSALEALTSDPRAHPVVS